ncbi:MAG: PQQ-dependent sugar dehydrogenase, partial [Dehalococcoidales bacterium]|nr:PQQ-dependent sugar dehydrogenase [Dehalococcoidales bacterium]
MNRKSRLVIVSAVILATLLVIAVWWNFRSSRITDLPAVPPTGQTPGGEFPQDAPLAVSLAQKLEIPWALDFLPDGSIVLTERPGRVRLVDAEQGLLPEPLLTVEEVVHRGEGGLLGIAVHPDFAINDFIYVYYTYQGQDGLSNRVVRFRKEGNQLIDKQVILDGIPAASVHNGGRIKFGPDGLLYITAGDAAEPDSAQNISSLAGKILRLNDDGSIPPDNPFPGSPVYSLGHRNPQGLAWDSLGRLWEVEHGSSATDELNMIQAGRNYGWPVLRGDETAPELVNPVLHSGRETWAPSGLAFLDGSLFYAGLRGQTLYKAVLDG